MKKIRFSCIEQNPIRKSYLIIDGGKINTPIFFPVISFFGGCKEDKLFGGGIYRKLKERILKDEKTKKMFKFVMTSYSQLQDFPNNIKLLDLITKKTIKEWFNLKDSIIFVDSGGFKLLEDRHEKYKELYVQEKVYEIQMKFGADIIVPLDYPLSLNLPEKIRRKRMMFTIKNSVTLIHLDGKKTFKLLPIHGHSKKEIDFYLKMFFKELKKERLDFTYDGFAVGSIVPFKGLKHKIKIIQLIKEIKKILKNYEMENKFIHVFGASKSLIEPLSLLVDSFDSSSYIFSFYNGGSLDNILKSLEEILNRTNVAREKNVDCLKKLNKLVEHAL